MNRHSFMARSFAFALMSAASLISTTALAAEMVVYKGAACQCCDRWAEALKASGIPLRVENVEDMDIIRASYGIPDELQSCHTAFAAGYIFEGHVPLEVVQKILADRPAIVGVAVPGMPAGSLGMGTDPDASYDVIALHRDGSQSVFMEVRPQQ